MKSTDMNTDYISHMKMKIICHWSSKCIVRETSISTLDFQGMKKRTREGGVLLGTTKPFLGRKSKGNMTREIITLLYVKKKYKNLFMAVQFFKSTQWKSIWVSMQISFDILWPPWWDLNSSQGPQMCSALSFTCSLSQDNELWRHGENALPPVGSSGCSANPHCRFFEVALPQFPILGLWN